MQRQGTWGFWPLAARRQVPSAPRVARGSLAADFKNPESIREALIKRGSDRVQLLAAEGRALAQGCSGNP